MPNYYVLRGLPGSGKSTFASNLNAENVGRDRIRDDLFNAEGAKLSNEHEDRVTQEQQKRIKKARLFDRDVVLDEMNLQEKYMSRHRATAINNAFDLVVVSFLEVPLETCVRRDGWRLPERQIGEGVIRTLHRKFVEGNV